MATLTLWQQAAKMINLCIGLSGALLIAWFVKLTSDVLRGPGDDNPIVFVFYLGAVAALVPTWGLIRAAAGWGFGTLLAWIWLCASLAALCILFAFAWQFL
jgi:hypothetical protein